MDIALIADDTKKELMTQFCIAYCGILSKHHICATSTTGKYVSDATGLEIETLLAGEHGGEQQIGSRISYNEIDVLLYFRNTTPDENGWKEWCDKNSELIKNSFYRDLGEMTQESQHYFGDWVRFEGHPDVGYYLGARFVRYLLKNDCFESVNNYTFQRVKTGFNMFMHSD